MSSEAAQKAYPDEDALRHPAFVETKREAFDRGAVEALRQAAEKVDKVLSAEPHCDCGNIRVDWEQIDRAFEWEAGK